VTLWERVQHHFMTHSGIFYTTLFNWSWLTTVTELQCWYIGNCRQKYEIREHRFFLLKMKDHCGTWQQQHIYFLYFNCNSLKQWLLICHAITVNKMMSQNSSLFISELLAQCKSNQLADILSIYVQNKPFSSFTPEMLWSLCSGAGKTFCHGHQAGGSSGIDASHSSSSSRRSCRP